jgi:hypothetical protein
MCSENDISRILVAVTEHDQMVAGMHGRAQMMYHKGLITASTSDISLEAASSGGRVNTMAGEPGRCSMIIMDMSLAWESHRLRTYYSD